MPERRVQERRHVEGVRVRSVNGSIHARAVKVECEDRQQHNDEPDLREDEELKGRVSAVRPTPNPDEEEHRNDDEFPENRKEQEVEGHEDADEGHLEEQEEAEERLRSVLFVPVEDDREGRQQGREPDERDAQTVHTDDVVETELRPSRIPLHVVQRDVRARRGRWGRGRCPEEDGPARVDESYEEQRRKVRLDQTDAEGNELRRSLGCPNEPGDDCADERDQDEEAQDVRHLIDPAPTTNAGGNSVRT